MMSSVKEVIEANLENGAVVYTEAKKLGVPMSLNEDGTIDIADIAAVVDHESAGGQNVFGCDSGGLFCNEEVTRERVDQLLAWIEEGGNSNGVGLTQLTYPPLIYRAEERGGAHLPEHQCSVGFEHLMDLVNRLGYVYGIAAYNVGEGNPQDGVDNGYFGKIMAKREKWKGLLAEATDETKPVEQVEEKTEEYPTLWLYTDESGWEREWYTSKYIRTKEKNVEFASDGGGWLYVKNFAGLVTPEPASPVIPEPEAVSSWGWPEASEPVGYIGDGSYVDLHPTRYSWRSDVEKVARYLVDTYGVWCNTYVDHPPGWGLDAMSVDVWAYSGRGYTIDPDLGQVVFDDIFNNGKEPWIWWTIWWGWMWSAGGGWRGAPWGPPDSDPGHYGHIHFTFM